MSATTEDIADLLRKIVGLQTLDARLWDTADVALFLNLSVDHTRKYITTRSDFPAAVALPGKGNARNTGLQHAAISLL